MDPEFWDKIFKFFDVDRDRKNWIRDPEWKKVGSGINILDPQRCRILVTLSPLLCTGTSLAHKPYPSSGMTMMVGGGGALTPHNKFNTISNIHKRGAGGGE
jgi:hypothetical protein